MKKIGRTPKLVILRVGHDIKRMREVLLITHLTSTWQTLPCTSWQKCVNYPYKKHLKTSKDAEFEGSLFQNDEDTAWQSREIVLQILALLGREGACKMGRGAGGGQLTNIRDIWRLYEGISSIVLIVLFLASLLIFTVAFSTSVDGYYLTGHMEGLMLQT